MGYQERHSLRIDYDRIPTQTEAAYTKATSILAPIAPAADTPASKALRKIRNEYLSKPYATDWANGRKFYGPVPGFLLPAELRRKYNKDVAKSHWEKTRKELDKVIDGTKLSDAHRTELVQLRDQFVPSLELISTPEQKVQDVLNELIGKFAPVSRDQHRGRLRGLLIPLAAVAANHELVDFMKKNGASKDAIKTAINLSHAGLIAPITAATGSLTASLLHRIFRENYIDLFVRYSYTESSTQISKTKLKHPTTWFNGPIRGAIKTYRMVTRGAERAILKRMYSIGMNEKVRTVAKDWGGSTLPARNLGWFHTAHLAGDAIQYLYQNESIVRKKGYLTPKELQDYTGNKDAIQKGVVNLMKSIPEGKDRDKMLHTLEDYYKWSSMKYWAGAVTIAGIGAAKAFLVDSIVNPTNLLRPFYNSISKKIAPLFATPPAHALAMSHAGEALRTIGRASTHAHAVAHGMQVPFDASIGQTMIDHGIHIDWSNPAQWNNIVMTNAHNTDMWNNAHQIALNLASNPENPYFQSAQASLKALQEAGYNATSGLLHPEALKNNLQSIFSILHWGINNEPVVLGKGA